MSLKTFLCNLLGCCTGQHALVPDPAPPVSVVLINQSSILKQVDVLVALGDLQTQVTRDFAPAWGRDAALRYGTSAQSGEWVIYLMDDSDVQGALGYHGLNAQGVPEGKVFVRTSEQNGATWTTVASHELLEMLADPLINSLAFVDDGTGKGLGYNVEVGDPVENDSYVVGSTLVSDFAYPAWFTPGEKGPYDRLNLVKNPLELRPGGYIGYASVSGFTAKYGDKT